MANVRYMVDEFAVIPRDTPAFEGTYHFIGRAFDPLYRIPADRLPTYAEEDALDIVRFIYRWDREFGMTLEEYVKAQATKGYMIFLGFDYVQMYKDLLQRGYVAYAGECRLTFKGMAVMGVI